MDFLNLNRLRAIFNPQQPIGNDLPSQGGITGNLPRVQWGGNHLLDPKYFDNQDVSNYTPQHDYSDLYKQGLDQMPVREEPGKLRRVFAAMAGLGQNGPENQERVKYGPYLRKLGDWEERMKMIQPGMTAERYENANERMLAQSAASDILRARDIARKESTDAANIEIRQGRAKAYADNLEFKQNHPKHELKPIPGGNYVWMNPEDPTEQPIDTGIKSGTLSKIEEMNLAQRNALQRIAAQGSEARKTEAVRSSDTIKAIGARGEQARTTKAAPSDTGSETLTETTVAEKDEAGNPTKIQRRVVKKPLQEMHRMQYKGKDGQMHIIRVPKEKVAEASSHGAKDLGVIK